MIRPDEYDVVVVDAKERTVCLHALLDVFVALVVTATCEGAEELPTNKTEGRVLWARPTCGAHLL